MIEVVHHEHGVEAGHFGLPARSMTVGKRAFDAGAVAKFGILVAEFDAHPVDPSQGCGPGGPGFALAQGSGTGNETQPKWAIAPALT